RKKRRRGPSTSPGRAGHYGVDGAPDWSAVTVLPETKMMDRESTQQTSSTRL
ncbi:uncharacterized, partial [Tachysurus ichikawai]